MVSLVISSLSLWLGTNHTVECGGNLPARADSDEPDAGRADAHAVGRALRHRSGVRGGAQTKDGAGGGPAEEQKWVRGHGMRLLKIGESRTRMRGRDANFRLGPLSGN